MNKIIRRMEETKNIRITIPEEAYASLRENALADLSNGGRGVGNQVESLLINPLSRYLFDAGIMEDADIVVDAFEATANPPAIRCHREEKKHE